MDEKFKNIIIDLPLRGEWVFLRPFGHHKDAFDFVKADEKRKKYSTAGFLSYIFYKIPAEKFYSWSKPIFAPVDGVVIQISDDCPDNQYVNLINTIIIWFRATFLFRPKTEGSKIDIRPNVGNHVMIKSKFGFVVFMAHMRMGSARVKVGQQVNVGEIIGEIGNSGSSTMPHLHINLFDQMDEPLKAKVLPFVFSSYENLDGYSWNIVKNNIPKKNDIVRHEK